MNITVEKQPDCLAKLTAEVPADSVEKTRSEIMKAYAKEAKIPGFRPGKAPAKVIAKRYQKEIGEELEMRLIRQATEGGIQQEELRAVEVKRPEKFEFNDDGSLSLVTEVILAPDIELPEYKGVEVKVESEEVTDEDMENAITQLQERHAEYTDVDDRGAETGDIAVITYKTTQDGKPLDEAVGKPVGFISGREGFWVKIQEGAFLPGFTEELVGLKTGEEKDITLTLPEDFPVEDLRGVEVVFATKLDTIKQQTLPELNDEFANKIAEGKSMDEVKDLLRENVAQQKTRHIGEQKVQQILEKVVGGVECELPQLLVDREAQGIANQMVQQAQQRGAKADDLKGQEEEILGNAREQARQNLKTNFVLQEIAQKEKVELQQQDVIQRIVQIAQQQNKKPEDLMKELQKNNQIPAIQNQVLIGKTIDFLINEAKVEIVAADELPTE